LNAIYIYIALAYVFQPYIILRQVRKNVRNVSMAAHIHTPGTARPFFAFVFSNPAGTKKNRPERFFISSGRFQVFLAWKTKD